MAALVVTLGPASATLRAARALVDAGADQARINASHLDPGALVPLVELAWEAGFASVVVDLQGGKARLAGLAEPVELSPGVPVELVPDRPELTAALAPGDRLRVDDGRFLLEVRQVRGPSVEVVPDGPGLLMPRKGLSLVGREVELPDTFLRRDVDLLSEAVSAGVGEVAISYATPGLVGLVRDLTGEDLLVVAKLERPSSIADLDALELEADTLWLCRGDLGAEAGLLALPALQREALSRASLPLLIAGQVLHHMTHSPRPTRAEVCHASDLLLAGAAGFVLSDETAIGPHGPAAVGWLRRILDAAG